MKAEQNIKALVNNLAEPKIRNPDEIEVWDVSAQRGLNLRSLFKTIKRKLFLIIGVTSLTTTTGWFLESRKPAIYVGNFQILVEPATAEAQRTDPSVITQGGRASIGNSSLDYPTLLKVLKSSEMLEKIQQKVKTRYPNFSLLELQKQLDIQRGFGQQNFSKAPSRTLEIQYAGPDPDLIKFVLEKAAEEYIQYSLNERKGHISEGVKFIDEQLPGLQRRESIIQNELQSLLESNNVVNIQDQSQLVSQQTTELESERIQLQRDLKELRSVASRLERDLGLDADTAKSAAILSSDPNYKGLLEKLTEVEGNIALASARFTEESPLLQELRSQQQKLYDELNKEAQQILGSDFKQEVILDSRALSLQNTTRLQQVSQLVDVASQIQRAEIRSQALNQTKTDLGQQVQSLRGALREYNILDRQLTLVKNTVDQLLAQRESLRAEAAQSEFPWTIISTPQIPLDPNGQPISFTERSKKMLVLGALAGLVFSLGAAIAIEAYRDIFYNLEDLQDIVRSPLFIAIPPERKNVKNRNLSSLQVSSPSSDLLLAQELSPIDSLAGKEFFEAFNFLYASLSFIHVDPSIQSLLVCSAMSGDGKSTVAANLAQAVAAMGRRVLLVDANWHSPQIHWKLNVENFGGLINALSSHSDPDLYIQRSPQTENLFVLTVGQSLTESSLDPIEQQSNNGNHAQAGSSALVSNLLASSQMQNLMEMFQKEYDLVIYDTPDLMNYADANFLAPYTDGILLVVGILKTKRSVLLKVMDQLEAFRQPILGIVANHLR